MVLYVAWMAPNATALLFPESAHTKCLYYILHLHGKPHDP